MAKRVSSSVLDKIMIEQEARQEKDLSELRAEVRTKAKRANQRLVRLEQSDKSEKSYAYNNAMKYLESKARRRFKENPKQMNETELNTELRRIEKFLNSATSTKLGIKKVNEKKEEATKKYIEETFGRTPTKKQYEKLTDILEKRDIWEYIVSILGSERAFKIIANASEEQKNEVERIFSLVYEENGKFYIHPNLIKTTEEVDWFNNFFEGNIIIKVKVPKVKEDETQDVLYE